MWVYDIKWDGEGNRIKDKARLVRKGYTQQLGIDYNETWTGVTRLKSVRMMAAIAAKFNLKLWWINFIGAYLNSLTKEDIYMKQPEGFVQPGFLDSKTMYANSSTQFMVLCKALTIGTKL